MTMKRLIYFAITASIAMELGCAKTEKKQEPFFNDVSTIELSSPGSNDKGGNISGTFPFTFSLPDKIDCKFIVLAIFNATTPPIPTEDNRISNTADWIAGNRTGLPGSFSGSTIITLSNNSLYSFNGTDFNSGSNFPLVTGSKYCWLVWAYDNGGNLVASSDVFSFTYL